MEGVIKKRRIGTVTFGILLVILGIMLVVQIFIPFELYKYVFMLWPLMFISIGIESLYYSKKDNIEVKYDILGMFLLITLLMTAGAFSLVNYGVNSIVKDKNIQKALIGTVDSNHTITFDNDKVEILNISNKQVKIHQVISETDNYAVIKTRYAEDKIESISDLMNEGIYKHISVVNNGQKIVIEDLPEYINGLDIYIYTKSKDNITLENCESVFVEAEL